MLQATAHGFLLTFLYRLHYTTLSFAQSALLSPHPCQIELDMLYSFLRNKGKDHWHSTKLAYNCISQNKFDLCLYSAFLSYMPLLIKQYIKDLFVFCFVLHHLLFPSLTA